MDEKLITRTIRTLRKKNKISLDKLSKLSGLSPGYLSKVERSEKAPPLSTLDKIALALGVELSDLLREDSDVVEDTQLAIVRKNQRKKVQATGSLYGYDWEALAFNKSGKNMEPFILSPAFDEKTIFHHEGEEFMYVLEGTHEFVYGDKTYILNEGDSIYYDACVPHTGRSLGEKKARVLVVTYSYKRNFHHPAYSGEEGN